MKKIVVALFSSFIVFTSVMFCGCSDNNFPVGDVLKIKTVYNEGVAPFERSFVRMFDFEAGLVTDMCVTDEENIPDWDNGSYNIPEKVTDFTYEQAAKFIEAVRSLGFFGWGESYVETGVFDAGSYRVMIYFVDGTEKTTYIYFSEPPHYKEINEAFFSFLGAELYYQF